MREENSDQVNFESRKADEQMVTTSLGLSIATEAEKNRGESLEVRQFILQPLTGDSGMVVPDGTGSKMKVK